MAIGLWSKHKTKLERTENDKGVLGVCSGAPLISVKALIVSSGCCADEELHRRQEEREEKEKLVVEGRC